MNVRWLTVALAAVTLPAAAADETYVFDPTHSMPQWEANHMGMSTQRGGFGKMSGKVVLDRAGKKGSVDVTIDATSIRTFDMSRLDAVVKGERFFNVEKFPTITFKSNHVTFDGDRITAVDGDLTMLGVTKPVTLKMVNFNCGPQPFNKKPMCGGDASATIKRSEWGMTQGVQAISPSDEIKLWLPFEAYLTPAD